VRAESQVEQAQANSDQLVERIEQRLHLHPDRALEAAEMDPGQELPAREEVESQLQRLTRERDNIGPVNLRAEQEERELQERIDGMQAERQDLTDAIARLRSGIASLNREGRERLLKAFEEIQGHFTELFGRLFGGGEAQLSLTQTDDPLDAGLEIYASPPGKKLQVMSLLSGGEQALTALALLFAVFLVNPAPICVLDEVDAPLDDANVDRFCTLVEELSKSGRTRFLVITHHRMTMARMDRLFGVTMSERGVSQLVSVDLQAAEELRESA
jgi:chromosome segregation protein